MITFIVVIGLIGLLIYIVSLPGIKKAKQTEKLIQQILKVKAYVVSIDNKKESGLNYYYLKEPDKDFLYFWKGNDDSLKLGTICSIEIDGMKNVLSINPSIDIFGDFKITEFKVLEKMQREYYILEDNSGNRIRKTIPEENLFVVGDTILMKEFFYEENYKRVYYQLKTN